MLKERKAQAAPDNPAIVDCTGRVCPKCGSPLQPKAAPSGAVSCMCPNCDRNIVNARSLFERHIKSQQEQPLPWYEKYLSASDFKRVKRYIEERDNAVAGEAKDVWKRKISDLTLKGMSIAGPFFKTNPIMKKEEGGSYVSKYQKEFLKDEKEVNQKGKKEEKKFRKLLKRNPHMKDEAEIDLESFDEGLE